MNPSDIKRAIGKLTPDDEMENRLQRKLEQKPRKRWFSKPVAAIAAGLAIILCSGLLAGNFLNKNPNEISQNSGITIPKLELPENTNITAKMAGLIVYQGKIYTQSTTNISAENAENLLGDKLGTTKGNLTEWSKQDDYAVEFASTIGVQDVYTVKGYDKNFRIMTYEKIDGVVYPQLFECLNGITVKTGGDIFSQLKIEGNIATVKYEDFDSWNNGKQIYKSMTEIDSVRNFLQAVNHSTPHEQEELANLWEDQSADGQKFVFITLKDGMEVQLRLFKDGYVFYNGVNLFFKVDSSNFSDFWNVLA